MILGNILHFAVCRNVLSFGTGWCLCGASEQEYKVKILSISSTTICSREIKVFVFVIMCLGFSISCQWLGIHKVLCIAVKQ
jgi:hypothetical protein